MAGILLSVARLHAAARGILPGVAIGIGSPLFDTTLRLILSGHYTL